MAEPEFMRSPLDRVGEFLSVALDPTRSAEERARAFESLKALSDDTLRSLALDGDWRQVLDILGGDAYGEMAGDGPWSESSETETPVPNPPTLPVAQIPILDLYPQDLRWLVRDDFRRAPVMVPTPSRPEAGPVERVSLSAAAEEQELEATEDKVRRLPWGLTNHGAALVTLREAWPEREDLLAVYMEECLARRADLGLPPRLAMKIEDVIADDSGARAWFDEVARWIDNFVEGEILDVLTVEQLADRHLVLRMEVSRRVRMAEITKAALISGTELYGTIRMVRAAATKDLIRAWHEGEGQIGKVVRRYDEMNKQNDLFFDRVFRGVLRQPDSDTVQRLSTGDRQAASMARQVRLRAGHTQGFLAHGDSLL